MLLHIFTACVGFYVGFFNVFVWCAPNECILWKYRTHINPPTCAKAYILKGNYRIKVVIKAGMLRWSPVSSILYFSSFYPLLEHNQRLRVMKVPDVVARRFEQPRLLFFCSFSVVCDCCHDPSSCLKPLKRLWLRFRVSQLSSSVSRSLIPISKDWLWRWRMSVTLSVLLMRSIPPTRQSICIQTFFFLFLWQLCINNNFLCALLPTYVLIYHHCEGGILEVVIFSITIKKIYKFKTSFMFFSAFTSCLSFLYVFITYLFISFSSFFTKSQLHW